MKSKIEIREFAISKAVDIMGTGTPAKDVVSKAREIEQYIIGEADIPEVYNQEEVMSDMFVKGLTSVIGANNVGE